jgi:hypothetical protein
MSTLKYFSFFLGLSLILSSCWVDFSDKKEKEVEKESEVKVEEDKDGVIRIEVDGEEVTIDSEELEEEINSGVQELVRELTESLEEVGEEWNDEDKKLDLMDHRELKSMLPDRLGWTMPQTEHSSEKSGVLGFRTSKAEAKYESKLSDKWIKIELVDLGGMPFARFGLKFWDDVEVDRESKDEYEKTYEKDGNKYHEKYNKKYEEGKLVTVIKDRYVLNIEGKNVKLSDLEDARDKVKIRKLQ